MKDEKGNPLGCVKFRLAVDTFCVSKNNRTETESQDGCTQPGVFDGVIFVPYCVCENDSWTDNWTDRQTARQHRRMNRPSVTEA